MPKVQVEEEVSIDIDLAWDDVPRPCAALTVPAPPPDSGAEGSVVDVRAASRSANAAAAMGRAPPADVTTKLPPFQLAEALARATARDDDDS